MDKVSIVLPTHNGFRYLRQSIDSCLNQTYSNIELIVVDDGSTDETSAILQSYDDPRLIVLRHETNRGLPAALNTGFAHASGQYLTWTSDDNYHAPEAIKTLVEFLELHPDVDFVYANYWRIDDQGQIIGEVDVAPIEALKEYNCVGPCFLYRREVHESIGQYNPKAAMSEDTEYWLRVSLRFRMEPCPKRLYYYRWHTQSLSETKYGKFRARRVGFRVRRDLGVIKWSRYARAVSDSYIDEAFESYWAQDLANLRCAVVRGLLYNPSWVRNRGVISIFLESLLGARMRQPLRNLRRRLSRTRDQPG
jgi:glycosyltransferase involved in cell wall biosynthesis